jgi:uncharacterized protein
MRRVSFLDSSALVKRYVNEAGSEWVGSLLTASGDPIIVSSLAIAEVSAAIVRRVAPQRAKALISELDQDARDLMAVAPMSNATVLHATELVRRHKIRGCDGLQLAAAIEVANGLGRADLLEFVSSDLELNAAARAEGLRVATPPIA